MVVLSRSGFRLCLYVGIGQIPLEKTEAEMKEYTIAATVSAVLVVILDRTLGTRLTGRVEFWAFVAVMFGFKLIFNGYLTWRPIVMYGQQFFLDVRLGTIPVEDFLFAFSMITLSVVLWEFGRKRRNSVDITGAHCDEAGSRHP